MPWQVRKRDVDFFVHDLWKDSRSFTTSPKEFGKDCFAPEAARLEATVITGLARVLGPGSVPTVHDVKDSMLVMERVPGVRLFDLIRHLKALARNRDDSNASAALRILMARAGLRLTAVQLALKDLAGSGELGDLTPYPLELKISQLLNLFIRVLGLRSVPSEWATELASLTWDWQSSQCTIPFRDATTKNMIVRLSQSGRPSLQDPEGAQRAMVDELLESCDESFWQETVLTDIDFSSVVNLTSPEDDPISLYFHEWTAGSIDLSEAALILDKRLGEPNPRRAAMTLMVRYLRFGGRKLAYKLINSHGFSVRFAYDNPLYYFENLRAHCDILDPTLSQDCPHLFEVFELVARSVREASASDLQITQIDHLRRYHNMAAEYWQQSPFESY